MKAKLPPAGDAPDWARLVDAEHRLEAEIAAAQADAQARSAAARALPDPAVLAEIAAQQQQADTERHRSELERLDQDAERAVRVLTQAQDPLIDTLARAALDAAWSNDAPPERR
ncbi:MAG: hypothetical protein Q8M01_16125 [Rubrivivax sp.]|nr:hypothetical protein [Rubrivivax sp.]